MSKTPGGMVRGLTLIVSVALLNLNSASRAADDPPAASRTRSGLLALYEFGASTGPVVKDTAGVDEPLNLLIENEQAVRRTDGSLEVRGKTLIRTAQPPARLIKAVQRSGEITIETWIRSRDTTQAGPARIVTLSQNPTERNFTLGQEGDRFEVRLRTTRTSRNGLPALDSGRGHAGTRPTHLVYTRDRTGRTFLHVDGRQIAHGSAEGETSNWASDCRLALANELSKDRPWLGTFYLVAIYDRALQPQEIAQHFAAGSSAATPPALAPGDDRFFLARIAPLLAEHCLECHDPGSRQGGLDLSRKVTALAGGDTGRAIIPGKPAESLLWQQVTSGEMPQDRPPLPDDVKQALREWIAAGAVWPLDVIDPSLYVLDGQKKQRWLQRLTVPEYIETVRSAVKVDVTQEARELLPKDLRADGFSNTAYNLNIDLDHVEAYAKLAETIVGRMDVKTFAARFSEDSRLSADRMRPLIEGMGKHLLRGPLTGEETASFLQISETVSATGGDAEQAVSYILEAMLQSPRFIYRMEDQSDGGIPRPVSEYELASRLSYILWGGPPDEELMRAADEGRLSGRLEAQARRMLRDPRAIARSRQFVHEWLNLDRLENLQPDSKHFPQWDPRLAADMRAETLDFFEEHAWRRKRPLAELFNAQFTVATPRLASHYGLEPQDDGPALYDLSEVPDRGGLLTHGSVLTIGGDHASMVTRGLFVLNHVLRGRVNAPPACVDTTPVPTEPGLSQRRIAEIRLADSSCAGCHRRFEPLAFSLERFDGIGAWHRRDQHGNDLRQNGEILFPGAEKAVTYETTAELANLLADSPRVSETITWKLAQFSLGRPLMAGDLPELNAIHETARTNGGTYAAVMTALLTSELVRMSRTESQP
ncbi:MAG: DUF1592 domain-containing protein [Planctomycetaceae bacterium]|nr:DUF1592 domain-containing protein [Planctomycetaceae bacterium]